MEPRCHREHRGCTGKYIKSLPGNSYMPGPPWCMINKMQRYDCLSRDAAIKILQPLCTTLLFLPPWFRAVINFNLISLQQFK
jgi:hypothetical protein